MAAIVCSMTQTRVVLLLLLLMEVGYGGKIADAWTLGGGGRMAHDYKDALSKSILFFEGQRSGKLPTDQRMKWRGDSGLRDGMEDNVDLVGGYYDAGDGVKFSFPMAFASSMLAWSVVEFRQELDAAGELHNALAALRWASDYLLKTASATPNRIYAQIGNPNSDHACWERPEDMDTPRDVYFIDPHHPGSDLAAEIAAAFAASSIAFKPSDPSYSKSLLAAARAAFKFADAYRGSYSDAFSNAVCPFYCSYSGYQDELLWGAAWLYRASKEQSYLTFIVDNKQQLAQKSPPFSWDDKHAGVHVLLSQILLNEAESESLAGLQDFKYQADDFVCSLLPSDVSYAQQASMSTTSGGLLFVEDDINLQYVTAAAFLLLSYEKHLSKASSMVTCQSTSSLLHPHELWLFAKHQVDYILGENPMKMSYMVGYGNQFPRRLHHRGSSMPSVSSHPQRIGCKEGFAFFSSSDPNPNLLVGAVTGGPDSSDSYSDDRSNYKQSEPTLYVNAPFVGALAYIASF